MIQSLVYLQNKYLTGLVPTQDDYHDIFDSYWHKQEIISQDAVERLAPLTVTIGGSGSISTPVGGCFVIGIVLIPSVSGAFTIGSTNGGSEYDSSALSGNLQSGVNYIHNVPYRFNGASTVYFTGSFDVEIYLR